MRPCNLRMSARGAEVCLEAATGASHRTSDFAARRTSLGRWNYWSVARINRAMTVSLDASWLGGTRRRLARPQKLRIEIYKVPQRFCHPLGKSRHDRSRKAVSDKDHIIQVFIPYDLHDIDDKRLPRGLAANRCENARRVRLGSACTLMSELPQARGNLFPAPAFEGATMNQHIGLLVRWAAQRRAAYRHARFHVGAAPQRTRKAG